MNGISTSEARHPVRAERLHIGLLGARNAGKSSLLNALAGQDVAIVSETPGTTTDPVWKAVELRPLGPVVLVDTAGWDDDGTVGALRVERTRRVLRRLDLALVVVDASAPSGGLETARAVLEELERVNPSVPVLLVWNKADRLAPADGAGLVAGEKGAGPVVRLAGGRELPAVRVSARTGEGIDRLRASMVEMALRYRLDQRVPLVEDLVAPGSVVVLVTPIDSEAPAGRVILPQQQVLRALLDHGAVAVVARETELATALGALKGPPALVVTDSQAFGPVARVLPPEVPLTSFSILFARYKGDLGQLLRGVEAVDRLRPGDRVLVAEACTHSPASEVDIGRVKIPRLLEARVGGRLEWTYCTGYDFPQGLGSFRLAIHCGGCMLNRREMQARLALLRQAGVPVVNYGVLLAHLTGVLHRAIRPLLEAAHAART